MNSVNVEVNNLTIQCKERLLVDNTSFSLNQGDVVLLEGNNGTGKTTLLKALIGIRDKGISCNGEVNIAGFSNILSMKESDLLRLRSNIGYLEQKDPYDMYYGITVKDVLADSLEAKKNAKLNKDDYKYVECTFNKYVPPETRITLKSKVNKLSGGQQRIVSIIASLCLRQESRLFIIDEPLNNLDINAIVHISNMLNKIRIDNPNATLIIVSHCKIFPFISKVATIDNGKIVVSEEGVVCNACFGNADADGFYIL